MVVTTVLNIKIALHLADMSLILQLGEKKINISRYFTGIYKSSGLFSISKSGRTISQASISFHLHYTALLRNSKCNKQSCKV